MIDLVVMSLEPWDGVWRRNQHLVGGLLRSTPELRVLFVEPAADPLHQLSRRHRPRRGLGLRTGPRLVSDRADSLLTYQPTKWAPRRIDPWVDRRLARRVVAATRRVGMASPVLWVNDPGGADVLRLTGWRSLYDITDDWLLAPRTPAETARLRSRETYLMQRCQEVVVCSPALQRSKGRQRRVRLIPNAVDVAAYRTSYPRPADLPRGPVAVYVGTLHRDRLDVDLCRATAEKLGSEATLVMVGPTPLSAQDQETLDSAGVRLLGARAAEQIPAYLQHADVLVVPHLVTEFTESLDPIKAYEYRAAGRPVVATPVAGFRDGGVQVQTVSARKFPATVLEQLTRETPTITDPEVPDWSDRVEQMRAVIAEVDRAR